MSYSISNNSVTIIFGKNGQEFYERIPYLNNTSLTAFNVFKNGTSSNLACLTGSGELIVISSEHSPADEMDISLAIEANAIKKFDYENDGIPDIAFVDEYDNSLKLLVNNSTGTTSKFYSIPIAEDHKEIQVDEFFSFRKIFYCYSKGTPLLEIFRYNFRTDMINRKQLYAPGSLLDVSFQRIDSSFVNIYVLYNKNSKMYLGKFENRDVSITFREYPFIDRNVSYAALFLLDEPTIYYWKSDGDQLQFNSARIKSGPNEYETHLLLPNKNDHRINFYDADRYNNEYPSVVSIAQNESENYLAIVSSGQVRISKKIIEPKESKRIEFGNAYFGETSIKSIINFTINSISDNYIYKLIYRQNEKLHALNQMFVAENLSDYLFARLDKKNYFLVYSNKKKGCISIKSLKK
jgi:hypothetical protein